MTPDIHDELARISDSVHVVSEALEQLRGRLKDQTGLYDMLSMVALQQLLSAKLILTMLVRIEAVRETPSSEPPILVGTPVIEEAACEDCHMYPAAVGDEPYRLCSNCNRKLRRNRK